MEQTVEIPTNRAMAAVVPIQQSKYLPSLDGLRCFSILSVIVTHINVSYDIIRDPRLTWLVNSGLFGVRVFFVISGFIITTLLLREKVETGSISLKNFYFRRALRILPLAYCFLITMVALNRYLHLGIGSADFVSAFCFFKNIRVASRGYLEHYWSLSVEEQYYIVFPFLLARGIKTYLLICLCFIGLYFTNNMLEHFLHVPVPQSGDIKPVGDIIFSISTVSILIGSLSSILLFNYGHRILTIPWNTTLLVFVQVSAMLAALVLSEDYAYLGATSVLSSGLIGLAILLFVRFPQGPVYAILNTRPVKFIGRLSFSLYVWQQIFTTRPPWAPCFKYADSILLNLAGLFAVALLTHYAVEKPFMRLRARYRRA
jgi:peptidoglycan/LPS O-acetylase OafA/YrhL